MFKNILYETNNEVGTITFNRPEKANGFNEALGEEFICALEKARVDDTVKVIVIKGKGKIFSAGGDIGEMRQIVEENNKEQMERMIKSVAQVSMLIKEIPKPVIFVVTGAVAGAAFNMVLAADFCIAADHVKFIQAFVNIGLAPDAGGLYLLAKSVGINKAIQLAMTGDSVTAREAYHLGFVYKVSTLDLIEEDTKILIEKLLKGPQNSYGAMKRLLWEATLRDWKQYTDMEVAIQTRLSTEDNFKEGVMAFIEKRTPNFR